MRAYVTYLEVKRKGFEESVQVPSVVPQKEVECMKEVQKRNKSMTLLLPWGRSYYELWVVSLELAKLPLTNLICPL